MFSQRDFAKLAVASLVDLALLNQRFMHPWQRSMSLMYHDIALQPDPRHRWTLSLSKFKSQIDILRTKGYSFASPADLLSKASPQCCITFDDACEGAALAFDYLLVNQITFVLFVPVDLLDTPGHLSSAYIKDLSASSLVTIGSHSMSHPERMDSLPASIQEFEISTSRSLLRDLTGQSIDCFSYPHGIYSADTVRITRTCGYKQCFTSAMGPVTLSTDSQLIPRLQIWGNDTRFTFSQKVRGAWDWINHV